MERSERELDVILWGASGFTGRLVAAHLHAHAETDSLRWALGGRDAAKLAAVRDELGADRAPIVIGDAGDGTRMAALAARTKVMCTTVGPYTRYGSALLAACAAAGTHYCDLTGEVAWVRRMLDAHHARAVESGARIVPCCGFDSIPSDLGVLFVQRTMRSRYGAPSPHVKCGVARFRGGVSGGTVASMLTVLEDATTDRAVRRVLADPYALNPEGRRRGPDGRDRMAPAYDADFGTWTAPFVMASVNTRVVRRSAALLPDLYGPQFRYDEATLTGRGARGAVRATIVAAGLAAAMTGLALAPVRRVVAPRLPQPGQGPTPEEQERGGWEMRFLAHPPHAGPNVPPQRFQVSGDRDPGYGSTSKMLAESAVCLARDPLESGGGFHTPASAMGARLIERLQDRAGVTFEAREPTTA